MDHDHLRPTQRAYIQMGHSGMICFFALGVLSIVPLIDSQAISWHDIGLIFIACLLIALLHGIDEFLRPVPQETAREVDNVIRRFEKRLSEVHIPSGWQSSGPYSVLPPTQQAIHHQETQKVPAVTFPNTTWQPSTRPTQQMPAMHQTPQTSQQILRVPHHFQI